VGPGGGGGELNSRSEAYARGTPIYIYLSFILCGKDYDYGGVHEREHITTYLYTFEAVHNLTHSVLCRLFFFGFYSLVKEDGWWWRGGVVCGI
jgi:hypothetical protein